MLKNLISWLAYKAIDVTLLTCRIRWEGLEEYLENFKDQAVIIMLWHENIIIVPRLMARYCSKNKYAPVISKSRDGQLLTYSVMKVVPNNKIIEVPHNARHKALKGMLKAIKEKYHIVITPDGPKGPCHKIKPGMLYAAQRQKTAIIPLRWSSTKIWNLKSWDKMKIPKPFSTINVVIGPEVKLPEDKSEQIKILENSLES